ncbi:MAG: GAF and ANTAR domain-containing protein [Actinocatenispora sp.]
MDDARSDVNPHVERVRSAVVDALKNGDQSVDQIGRVCRACVELLPVDGASIAVMSGTQNRETLYASDDVVSRLEALQFTLGEGPCFEAFDTGRPVLVPDLDHAATRAWPVFASEIIGEPVGAIFAFPVQNGAFSIGAIDMYRREPGWLSPPELAIALQVVDVASVALLGLHAKQQVGRHMDDEALLMLPRERIAVHQATGMLIAQFDISPAEALARLRGYAFATGRLVEEVSREIVERRLVLDDTESI